MHVDEISQKQFKQDLVKRALRHVPCEVRPILSPTSQLQYRIRARFVKRNGILGYQSARSNTTTQIAHCPALHPTLDRTLATMRDLLCSHLGEEGTLSGLIGLHDRVHISVQLGHHGQKNRVQTELEKAVSMGTIAGAMMDSQHVAGSDVSLREGLFPLRGSAATFAQAGMAGHTKLPEMVAEAVGWGPDHARWNSILELHAGSGNFTHFLINQAHVLHAVEQDPSAVASMKNWLPPPHQLHNNTVEKALEKFFRTKTRFDVVVLDPPRTGAKEAMPWLNKLLPDYIVYVSCDPMTLARDLLLLKEQFTPHYVQPIDLVPQTAHVETVALLKRSGPLAH